MPNIALSEACVKALQPRQSAYDIRDVKLRGFGVRVLSSSAKRFFIHSQHRGTCVWKMVGDANAMSVDEARAGAASLVAVIRFDADAPASPDATRFETPVETLFRRHARVWKPQTLYVNRNYLHRRILPRFAGTQIADITRADVPRWFATRRATSVGADRSKPVLSVIMKEAERMGYRPEGPNPGRGYDSTAARDVNGSCPMPRLAALRKSSRCMRANGRWRWPRFDYFCSRGVARSRC